MESKRTLWNLIFNSDVESMYCRERDKTMNRWTSKKRFFHYLQRANNLRLPRLCRAWRLNGAAENGPEVEERYSEELKLSKKVGQYLFSSTCGRPQTSPKESNQKSRSSQGTFMFVRGTQGTGMWVCPKWHKLFYQLLRKNKVADILKREEGEILKNSKVTGHWYGRHAGMGWRIGLVLWNHIYLIPKGTNLK